MAGVGIVIIGRNEGERLHACLRSVSDHWKSTIYVDSGSSDGSVEFAQGLGIEVASLDLTIPFTAARARNQGLARLAELHQDVQYVQFIDGDCVLHAEWINQGLEFLESEDRYAAVCGRLRERNRDQSTYNRLLDMEWNAPSGTVSACGGIAMFRIAALNQVGGFNPGIIAGEEPELCVRLRLADWLIMRLDTEMATHDAAITQFHQWWKRAKRAGHAYAEGMALHGRTKFRHKVREVYSGLWWGAAVPLFMIATLILGFFWPWAWLGTGVAIIAVMSLIARIHQSSRRRGWSATDASLYAIFCALSKPATCQGICQYWWNRWRGKQSGLIEYKEK